MRRAATEGTAGRGPPLPAAEVCSATVRGRATSLSLEDERKGLEITMKGVEDSSSAAQAILNDGGNDDLMKQVTLRA